MNGPPIAPEDRPRALRWLSSIRLGRRAVESDALLSEMPTRHIVTGLALTAVFLLVLLGWGLFARLDAAAVASGQIVVLGNRQTVQHREGGVVSELVVREGDHVSRGAVLLRLSAGELQANVSATADQTIQLKAQQARLLAELSGARIIRFPESFAHVAEEERPFVIAAQTLQQREFDTRAAAMQTAISVLTQKRLELAEQITGYRRQVQASREQRALVAQEMKGLERVVELGLVPATRVRSLQRTEAQLAGSEGEYAANLARTEQEIGETRVRASELERDRASEDSKDYRAAEFQLAELQPKLAALREQLTRTVVRAPASGRLVGLTIFTVGGVVTPGQKLMDVVPDDEPLIIEARVRPTDVADLHVGQKAEIKISAFHDRGMPKLEGVISKLSADSFADEKTGISFFKAQITVPASQIELIRKRRGDPSGLQAGLPVDVVIPLRARNALEYLVEPLQRTLWTSFREH